MNKQLPDKYVRKAIFESINNIIVNSITVPCFDSLVTGQYRPNHYVLMTTQTADVDKANKCEYRWQSSILLDVFTSYDAPGNTASRLLADDIANAVKNLLNPIVLDPVSGLEILSQNVSFPSDIVTTTDNQNVFRKLIRYELTIN